MKFIVPVIILFASVSIVGCGTRENQTDGGAADSVSSADRTPLDVRGDFDGDGKSEEVYVTVGNDGAMNPDEPLSYMISFSDPRFSTLEVSPMVADGYLVQNEGTLDGVKGDELSISVCDVNRAAALTVYRWTGSEWMAIAEDVNVACQLPEAVNPADLIMATDSGVYAMEYEVISYDSVTSRTRALELADAFGDFDGNNVRERVYVTTVADPTLDTDATEWKYRVHFSEGNYLPLEVSGSDVGGCNVVNEGDLDGVAGDELSVVQYGQMNKMLISLYSLKDGKWILRASEISNTAAIRPEDAIYKDSKGVFVKHQELGESTTTSTKVVLQK